MPIRVSKVFTCVDGTLLQDSRFKGPPGCVVGVLTGMKQHPLGNGPSWVIEITVEDQGGKQVLPLQLDRGLSADEYQQSFESPVCFAQLEMALSAKNPGQGGQDAQSVWLYRDALYLTERAPKESELEEVILRIKALHFQDDEALKRLREQVANFERSEEHTSEL